MAVSGDHRGVDTSDVLAPFRSRNEWGEPVTVYGQAQCLHPVQHMMTVADATTGECEPVMLSTACGNRRHTVCPYCSGLYQRDAWQVLMSGMVDYSVPLTSVTLTAPNMAAAGFVHCPHFQAPGSKSKHAAKTAADQGAPVFPERFDYVRAASWNASSSRLWEDFARRYRRYRYTALRSQGVKAREAIARARFAYVKVVEHQARGLAHHHVIIRGAHDPKLIARCVKEARAYGDGYTHRYSANAKVGFKIRPVPARDVEARRMWANYFAKYLCKGIASATGHDAPEGLRATHYERLRTEAYRQAVNRSTLCEYGVTLALLGNTWADGKPHICDCSTCAQARRYRRRAWEMMGHTGHVFSKSSGHGKRWGKTLGDCREARREWTRSNRDGDQKLVWLWEAFLGTGYGHSDEAQGLRRVAEVLAALEWGKPPPGWCQTTAQPVVALPVALVGADDR